MKYKLQIFFFIIFVIALVFFSFGFVSFFSQIKNYNVTNNLNPQGIAVLTGGKGRIAKGIEVFRNNPESYLIISGVDKKVSIEDVLPKDFLVNPKVFIDKKSETTNDNVNEIVNWSLNNNIRDVIIITSDYHMPRTMLILTKKGKGLNFSSYPVTSSINLEESFLKDSKTLKFLLEEYFKYILSFFINDF